jgi:hypothetical protein
LRVPFRGFVFLIATLLLLGGCQAANTQSTDHYQITFVNMDQIQKANQPVVFQFKVESKDNGTLPKDIILDFANVDMDHGKNEVIAKPNTEGVFEGTTTLPMGGKWKVHAALGKEAVDFPFKAEGAMH